MMNFEQRKPQRVLALWILALFVDGAVIIVEAAMHHFKHLKVGATSRPKWTERVKHAGKMMNRRFRPDNNP